ncbi:MAG: hypothetical protein ACLFM5_08020 [Spirochaetaceae bacterium]
MRRIPVLLASSLILLSCSEQFESYGVMLVASDPTEFESGAAVRTTDVLQHEAQRSQPAYRRYENAFTRKRPPFRRGITELLHHDPRLERLLESPWRPSYVKNTITGGRIELSRVDPRIGLFPQPSEDRILIDTGTEQLVFSPLEPRRLDENTYRFAGNLLIRFTAPDSIVVRYSHAGVSVQERFVQLSAELEDIMEEERERREQLFRSILRHGPRFESTHYGALRFRDGNRLEWSGRDALVPRVIPASAPREAQVRFNRHLSEELQERYDGAFSLVFDMPARDRELVFLYRLLSAGIRLTWVPPDRVNGTVVTEPTRDPLVMFFGRVYTGVGPTDYMFLTFRKGS